jgi:hypothetical protein
MARLAAALGFILEAFDETKEEALRAALAGATESPPPSAS